MLIQSNKKKSKSAKFKALCELLNSNKLKSGDELISEYMKLAVMYYRIKSILAQIYINTENSIFSALNCITANKDFLKY